MKRKKRRTYKRFRDDERRERQRNCRHKWVLLAPFTWSCSKCRAYRDEKDIWKKQDFEDE